MKKDLELMPGKIERAESIADLRLYHESISIFLQNESLEIEKIEEIFLLLNEIHDHLMMKALAIAEEEANKSGIGIKPEKISWYIMGSGARREQTLWTDQDNGIMFKCKAEDKEQCQRYVQHYAKIGTGNLEKIGYPFCSGNVMATNSRWAKDIDEWKLSMLNHINSYQPDDIRYLLIASDLRGIYGDTELIEEARKHLLQILRSNSMLLKRAQEHTIHPYVPIGFFGQIFTERWGKFSGQVDIKNSIYVQVVNCVKVLTFYANVNEYSTIERIEKLYEKGFISLKLKEQFKESFLVSLYLRLKLSIIRKGPDYHIYPNELNREEYRRFKNSMKLAKKLQHIVFKWNGD